MKSAMSLKNDHDYGCGSKFLQDQRHAVAAYPSPMASPWGKRKLNLLALN